MRAEDAAVDVRFVDDDVAQVVQHVRPAVVVRQQADMEHVGIREDHVRPAADLPPALGRRVAVVDRRADVRRMQRCQRPGLILRQRLGRVEVERTLLRFARQGVEHREIEAERLARRRPCREDQVLAARGRIPRVALVRVQRVEGQCRPQPRIELLGQRNHARLAGGDRFDMGELFAFEQVVPGDGAGGRHSLRSLRSRRDFRASVICDTVPWRDRGALRG